MAGRVIELPALFFGQATSPDDVIGRKRARVACLPSLLVWVFLPSLWPRAKSQTGASPEPPEHMLPLEVILVHTIPIPGCGTCARGARYFVLYFLPDLVRRSTGHLIFNCWTWMDGRLCRDICAARCLADNSRNMAYLRLNPARLVAVHLDSPLDEAPGTNARSRKHT